MRKAQINDVITKQIDRVYRFAFALTNDEKRASDLIVDATTIFLLSEKPFLEESHLDTDDRIEVTMFYKFVFKSLLARVYNLASKRETERSKGSDNSAYLKLNIKQRAVVFMKENLSLSVEEIQDALGLKRYQVIELLYQGRHQLLKQLTDQELVIT